MFRIILDTNVLINSERGSFSYPSRIMQEVIDGNLRAFASHRMKREHELIRRRLIRDPEVYETIETYLAHIEMIRPRTSISVVTTDHEDDKFIEAAFEAACDYIITNDHDLLNLGSYGETEIVTPMKFWKIYEDSKDPEGSGQWKDWISGFFQE